MRRGVLLLMAGVSAVIVTVSPLATQPANAQLGLDFGLGGNSCAIETVGWVICPTMRSIARLADKGFTYINQSSLGIDYDLFSNSGRTFDAWQVMRNIANGMFVIVFLIILYGYLVGKVGGNYNLKRLLPRLLIVAIAVNVSYYLAVIFVDLSNVIGDAIWNFMATIYGNGSPVMTLSGPNPVSKDNLTKMTAAVMGSSSDVWVILPLLAAVTITVALISAATVILIIMREALVATLILAAPILIVIYLLPNMERFFAQAFKIFLMLLLLYPIIALLLGTGQIVSIAAGGWSNPSMMYGGGTMSVVPDLVAAAAAVVPLLGVWFIFKNMSNIMSMAGSRLSATVAGRRGGKDDDKNARVTGKASSAAAGIKNATGLGGIPGRRQAFSRNRRHRSLGDSALTGEDSAADNALRAGAANRKPSENDALQNSLRPDGTNDSEKRAEELQNAKLDGDADNLNVENAAAAAIEAANGEAEKEKSKTAKDIFNNLNHAHESKDKDRKLGAGGPAGNTAGPAGGANNPTAPSTSYRAPAMAQGGNIVSGTSAPQQTTNIIAVPVQVDPSALLTKPGSRPPDNITPPPISGTEEKAKARAQKYLFDADNGINGADYKDDVLGHSDAPTEAPHTSTRDDKEHSDK